jgi:hypothetical protein
VEVVANFVYVSILLDSKKYNFTIENAIKYIISEQKAQGIGKADGTMVNFMVLICLRLLCRFPINIS